jgi:hypothetical protein
MTWPRLSMNKIWGEIHVEDTQGQRQNPISETLFLNKDWTMDNVQKTNSCINMPSSQTFRS